MDEFRLEAGENLPDWGMWSLVGRVDACFNLGSAWSLFTLDAFSTFRRGFSRFEVQMIREHKGTVGHERCTAVPQRCESVQHLTQNREEEAPRPVQAAIKKTRMSQLPASQDDRI